ncbi:hypothetical protein F2Q68_00008595 [Brassica cretica]|uniref:Uncharacterized protein n=1 Tax=Brassica cretica TaxID=69181 RepID=A0A8S9KZ19_BRACR|nr:hypothetical protein F2Q68_00008595 [Brassica cretica]
MRLKGMKELWRRHCGINLLILSQESSPSRITTTTKPFANILKRYDHNIGRVTCSNQSLAIAPQMTSSDSDSHGEPTTSLPQAVQALADLITVLTTLGDLTDHELELNTPARSRREDCNILQDTPIHGDLIVAVLSWRYVHDEVYGDLSLAVCRLTLHPWRLFRVVPNTVLTDRLRNHPRRSDRNQKYIDDSSPGTVCP